MVKLILVVNATLAFVFLVDRNRSSGFIPFKIMCYTSHWYSSDLVFFCKIRLLIIYMKLKFLYIHAINNVAVLGKFSRNFITKYCFSAFFSCFIYVLSFHNSGR